ncbi:unnamed protein product [Bursaphelenchus okinawaensis]|uniref:GSKIP domain-containing protein n=1 Tax=Bursaphelenchus okinawaensis TaxID=465554 RepID=A0A811K8W7_9BILA|nr:unnamed protein product [Bursaphelenchus okinawaensis]CAG9096753.1 unnamed protein product [Bursaphelenchus okinawaensis]
MATTGAVPSSKSLLDELNYAVIEVRPFVNEFNKSLRLTQGPELFYANLITLENKPATIELSTSGWRICSNKHNEATGEVVDFPKTTFETLSALLTTVSEGYKEAFAGSLVQRLEELAKQQAKEEKA